jgi:hypothetical protein
MQTCQSCIHWETDGRVAYGYEYYDQIPASFGICMVVKEAWGPKPTVADPEPTGAFAYVRCSDRFEMGEFLTRHDFGCNQFAPRPPC